MWRQMLADTADSFRRGAPAYPLTTARRFVNRWTLKNAQVFDEMPTFRDLMFQPLEVRRRAFADRSGSPRRASRPATEPPAAGSR